MKTVFFTLTMALIAFGAFSINSTAYACNNCGCSEMKKAGCDCGSKSEKPCEKTMGKKKPCEKTMGEKKPCEKTMGKKKPCSKSGYKSMKDHSNKGSLTIRSGSRETGRYN